MNTYDEISEAISDIDDDLWVHMICKSRLKYYEAVQEGYTADEILSMAADGFEVPA